MINSMLFCLGMILYINFNGKFFLYLEMIDSLRHTTALNGVYTVLNNGIVHALVHLLLKENILYLHVNENLNKLSFDSQIGRAHV